MEIWGAILYSCPLPSRWRSPPTPKRGWASKHSGGKPFFSLNLIPRKRWGAREYINARHPPRKQVGKGGVAGFQARQKHGYGIRASQYCGPLRIRRQR